MPTVDQAAESGEPQPLVLNDELARRTTRSLVGRLETVALLVQVGNIAVAATVDNVGQFGRTVLLVIAGLHLAAILLTQRGGGPFVRGGPFVVAWVGAALVMPILIASLLPPGEYGAQPHCVQLCTYPIAPVVMVAFYPWHSVTYSFLRPGVDILFLAAVCVEPLVIIWQINGFITPTNGLSVGNSAILYVLGYIVGKAVGAMCRTAARDQLSALRREYHRLFRYLHGQTEASLVTIDWYYTRGRHDLVLRTLRELGDTVSNERLGLLLTDDAVALSHLLNVHARRTPDELLVKLPRVGGISVPQPTARIISDILGDTLKNVVVHANATTVEIGFKLAGNAIRLAVQDDGIGFPSTVIEDPNTTLHSLRENIREAGGDLRLASHAGQGARIEVLLPIKPGHRGR